MSERVTGCQIMHFGSAIRLTGSSSGRGRASFNTCGKRGKEGLTGEEEGKSGEVIKRGILGGRRGEVEKVNI